MASLATRKQVMAASMCEGFVEMIWNQIYRDNPHNKTFAGIRRRMRRDTQSAYKAIFASGQKLSFDEWTDLKQKTLRFDVPDFKDGFAPMDAVGFMIDIVTEQLAFCRPGTSKHAAFDRLLSRVRELERYFDPKKKYDNPVGLAAGEVLRKIMAG